jgi:ZIP family zinc transporter
MSAKHHRFGKDYELLPRSSFDVEEKGRRDLRDISPSTSWLPWLDWKLPISSFFDRSVYTHYITPRRRGRSLVRLVCWSVASIPLFLLLLVLVTAVLFPSYTNRPVHYNLLRQQALATRELGRANVYDKKIFISAALYEEKGNLVSGAWGRAVLQLIDLLGPQNVHLSIYEDNPDPETEQALFMFRAKVPCKLCQA